jgi:hypothetical protein
VGGIVVHAEDALNSVMESQGKKQQPTSIKQARRRRRAQQQPSQSSSNLQLDLLHMPDLEVQVPVNDDRPLAARRINAEIDTVGREVGLVHGSVKQEGNSCQGDPEAHV